MSYRSDPEWQAARDTYVADQGSDEFAADALMRRIRAAFRMAEIEERYEQGAAPAAVGGDRR